jgi:BMFP domain-containing protein YqiC
MTSDSPRFIEEIAAKIDEIGERLSGLAANNPARSLEKNVKAAFACATSKLDLVPREEFEIQRDLLLKALDRLAELEDRVAAFEAGAQPSA